MIRNVMSGYVRLVQFVSSCEVESVKFMLYKIRKGKVRLNQVRSEYIRLFKAMPVYVRIGQVKTG